jgi:arylsulfatase A-like enzyme
MFSREQKRSRTRRRGLVAGAIWCLPPMVSGILLLGMSPGPAGDAGSSDLPSVGHGAPEPISPGKPEAAGPTQPNIVVIMVDDMRADDLSGPWMRKTRELLGAQGVRFANTFVPLPLCCPSRSSFLTGQYPHNHGVWEHVEPWGFPALDDTETLPVWLQRAGYNTAFLGKYLNGYQGQEPDGDDGDGLYIPPGWDDWKAALGLRGTYNYWGTQLNDNGRLRSLEGQYQTRAYGRIGSDMIRRWSAEQSPFFFWLNFTAPHTGRPCEPDDPGCVFGGTNPNLGAEDPKVGATPAVPPDRRGRYDKLVTQAPGVDFAGERDSAGKPGYLRNRPALTREQRAGLVEVARQRYEAESVVDDQVARLIATLRQTGELDNTVVMFTSDNGYFLGEHRLRLGKIFPYEPSIRVPLLMRGPGFPKGQVRTDPFSMIDFAPTILDLAGARASFLTDGISMVPTIRDGDRGWRRALLTETGPRDPYAALQLDGTPIPYDEDHPNALSPTQGVRVKDLMYIENIGGFRELYDLRVDPHELNNLADDPRYRARVQALAEVLDRLRGCVGAECEVLLPKVLLPRAAPTRPSTPDQRPTGLPGDRVTDRLPETAR